MRPFACGLAIRTLTRVFLVLSSFPFLFILCTVLLKNLAGAFFSLQVFWCLVAMTALDVWNGSDRPAVREELEKGTYPTAPYMVAVVSNDILLLRILPPVFFAAPFALFAGRLDHIGLFNGTHNLFLEATSPDLLPVQDDFALFCITLVLTSTAFAALCMLVGAACGGRPRAASAVGVVIMVFSLIFGGLLVSRASAISGDSWYRPLFYATPLSYSYEAMMLQVLLGTTSSFDPKGFDGLNVPVDGRVWLANFGMNEKHLYSDVWALLGFTVGGILLTLPVLANSFGRLRAEILGRGGGQRRQQSWALRYCCGFLALCARDTFYDDSQAAATDVGVPSVTFAEEKKDGDAEYAEDGDELGPLSTMGSSSRGRRKRRRSSDGGTTASLLHHEGREVLQASIAKPPAGKENLDTSGEGEPLGLPRRVLHRLSFQGVNAAVGKRTILRGIHGSADNTLAGGVLGILGPSGAGKTTLLDVIAGRKTEGNFSGRVRLHTDVGATTTTNNLSSAHMRRSVFGYVMQEDTLVPELTVRESLSFSATLRRRRAQGCMCSRSNSAKAYTGVTAAEHSPGDSPANAAVQPEADAGGDKNKASTDDDLAAGAGFVETIFGIVQMVIDELGLTRVADRRIGAMAGSSGRRGLSGGERKRVSIGMELVVSAGGNSHVRGSTGRSVLLLDEPTTGLDAAASLSVMNVLRSLVCDR